VKDLVAGVVDQSDVISISEHLRLINAEPLGDQAGILLGLFIVFANMTHPIMCRRATDQMKEISWHGGQLRPAVHVPREVVRTEVSPRSIDGDGPPTGLIRFDGTRNSSIGRIGFLPNEPGAHTASGFRGRNKS
jgi:hypothetical protein